MNMNKDTSTPTAFRLAATCAAMATLWLTMSAAMLFQGITASSARAWMVWGSGGLFILFSSLVLFLWFSKHLRERDEALAHQAQALRESQHQQAVLTRRLLAQDQATAERMAQALHDELGQRLYACAVLLAAAPLSDETIDLRTRHSKALSQIQSAMKALRSVLHDLRPPFLEDGGLMSALKHEIERLHPHRAGIALQDLTKGMRWDSHIEHGVFMIAREALLNAIVHAQARTIRTMVQTTGASLLLMVQDDGRGIPDEYLMGRPGHLGITGMRERAHRMGGQLRIVSAANQGSTVHFELMVTAS
jgi:signal transduction histidine kinase